MEMGKRDNQEDAIFPTMEQATDNDRVFVLCDGMGGHEHGEVASQTVCAAISEHLTTHWPIDGRVGDDLILDALNAAYLALDAKDDDTVGKKMGTTLTLVVLHKGGCTAVHVGDSRIYHLRPKERRILYRSRDHSLVTELYQAGEISYEEMNTSKQKNIITKVLMPGEENRVKPDIVHIGDLQSDDYLYLCSDGMVEQMDDEQLIRILCSHESDSNKRKKLIRKTADNNDNHSALLIHVKKAKKRHDEHVVDDELETRCNFLNIKPIDIDALNKEIIEEQTDEEIGELELPAEMAPKPEQEMAPASVPAQTETNKHTDTSTQTNYRWCWVLLMAAIVILAALVWYMSRES